MKTFVEFRSNEFPPYDGEEAEINPGLYGKRLAEFLIKGLRQRGFEPLEPIAEDWGWVIPIQNDGFKLWIGFLCFIEPHQPRIRRFPFLRRIDTTAKVTALQEAIEQVLSASPGIRNKQWWTYEEFTRPKKGTID